MPMPPPAIDPLAHGMFTWANVHPPTHYPGFFQYLTHLTSTFSGGEKIVTNEADLRNVTCTMLASMALSSRIAVGNEITLDNFQDAQADPWTQTPLHECFVQLITPNTRSVFQGLWYLGGAHQQCGTRLSIIIVNTQFMRIVLTGATVVVEMPDALMGASDAIDSIEAFNNWDAFWNLPPAHNLVTEEGTVDVAALAFYWSTFRQGFIHTAALVHGHLPRDRALETRHTGAQFAFDVDAKLWAAQLKKECEAASKSARSSLPSTPNRSSDSSPSAGGLNPAPTNSPPASPPPSGPQVSRLEANARRDERARKRNAKRNGTDDMLAEHNYDDDDDDDDDDDEDVPGLDPWASGDDADDDVHEDLIDAQDVLPELVTAVSTVFPKVQFAGKEMFESLMASLVVADTSDTAV